MAMNKKLLVVDDNELNREILRVMLEYDYDIVQAAGGEEALEIIDKRGSEFAVMLLDLVMPEVDGIEVLERLKYSEFKQRSPILVITGDDSASSEKICLDYGVSDFIHKPFNAAVVRRRIKNMVELFSYKNELEDTLMKQNDTLIEQNIKLKEQALQLEESNRNIIDILGTVVESRNLESGEHISRVKTYTGILAEQVKSDFPEYGITDETIAVMVPASVLHDIGKIAIPDNILLKPGRLTEDEFSVMKEHTTRGCELLDNITGVWNEDYEKMSYDICRYHHERYNGRGYPDGLSGDDIPIAAQIVSIADVYDALVHKRVYKDAYSCEMAYNMIVDGECGVFSSKLIECFKKVRAQFEAV